jgi:hypothetical protein
LQRLGRSKPGVGAVFSGLRHARAMARRSPFGREPTTRRGWSRRRMLLRPSPDSRRGVARGRPRGGSARLRALGASRSSLAARTRLSTSTSLCWSSPRGTDQKRRPDLYGEQRAKALNRRGVS